MNAIPPSLTWGEAADSVSHDPDAATSIRKWAVLQDAAEGVAMLAELEPHRTGFAVGNISALLREAPEWQRQLAHGAIDDLATVMEAGVAALLGITESGGDPRLAALALWDEFTAARAAILSVLSPGEEMEPAPPG